MQALSEIPVQSRRLTQEPNALELIEALEAFLPRVLATNNAPGLNLALAVDGALVWEAGFGWADAFKKVPKTPATIFHSGSMGKAYTGVAIMQLCEQGRLNLADAVETHVGFAVDNPLGGGPVTIGSLMTHYSGLGGDAASCVLGSTRPLRETVMENLARERQPGLGWPATWTQPVGAARQYSNLGIALLGLVVQCANEGGLSYSSYVEQEIMAPLGMTSSQYPPVQDVRHVRRDLWAAMSRGYSPMGGVWLETPAVYFEEFPAGGFVATPGDHVKLLAAMLAGGVYGGVRLLSEQSVAEMLSPVSDSSISHLGYTFPNERQGLIWWLRDWGEEACAFHHGGGHMFGWRTQAIAWPRRRLALVVAMNDWSAINAASAISRTELFITSWLQRTAPPEPNVAVELYGPGSPDDAWDVSYLRGALLAEALNVGLGVPTPLDDSTAKVIAARAVTETWSKRPPLWCAEAFLQGVTDMNAVEPTSAAVATFARSGEMKIGLERARSLLSSIGFGPGSFASLGGLLTP